MNLAETTQEFIHTLRESQTKKTSLPFIKHTLSPRPIVKPDEEFQALTIGGSTCQLSRMRASKKIHSLTHSVEDQPAFHTEKDFLEYFSKVLEPEVSVVGLNFAYPLAPIQRNGLLDGILVSGSKENGFNGLTQKPVGETVEKYIKQTQERDIRVSVANDTICLLLSGLTQYNSDELAAGIVGTGLNFALFLDKNTVVNLESANFDSFELSPEAVQIDKNSKSPETALFEKEVSGAYLYRHYNLIAQKKGLSQITSSKELDEKAQTGNTEEQTLATQVLTHSAELVACQIAGILEFQKKDLVFVMQGSLFWKGHEYKDTVEKKVQKLTDFKATFVKIDNADLLGAAKLVTI